jgi:hypothetical protein
MTVAGDLRIVPTQDIAELGPSQGQATVFQWKWWYSAQGLLVWAVLALAMVVPRANRDRKVLLILIPVAVVLAAWFVLTKSLHMGSGPEYQLESLVHGLVVAIAVLWLIADGLGHLTAAVRFFCALFTMGAVGILGVMSSFASRSAEVVILPIFLAMFAMVLLVAVTITVQQCRKDYSPGRFLLRIASWTVIGSLTVFYGYVVVVSLSSGTPLPATRLFAQFGLVGLMLGISLFLLILPYMVLAIASPFYLARMQACLGLPPRQPPPENSTG